MKHLLHLFIITLAFSCSSHKKPQIIKPAITAIDIKASMDYLASDLLEGRATGSKGIEDAAIFIENYLKSNGIKPYFETYRDSFKVNDLTGYNIVGVIEGNDPELKNEHIILGGHYDHIGVGKIVDGDSIANGANDDASGTIAAMEIGKYFAQTKSNKRSILITLYDAEELGLKGSAHLAERLKNEGLNAYTMINFEMIGVPRTENETMSYMSGYERSNFAETLNKYAGEEVVGYFPKAKEFGLFMRSDNFPFFKELNMPAHAISTFDFTNYDFYHHVDDEVDKMDYQHMANFINKIIPALEGMMNAPTKEVVLKDE
ncbi:M20/M25/M40 family metallo-hydrolase [Winogradskyella bathintestinalis]|uniref:M20/M25/M40 family metallo-hydrolase n=1 Tax=Winogradskyella bathintestinalis TaxID=3035208 RepID=A0ABT7ZY31_9FLAO|nr:M20/M25/M40 family metallo-hydrolase [Winogradskyella bathintestinalis]MDN3493925.1 M20/M25/M40 family metallo-hydrolase [Winogradskyella bathintestinalis]